jgi:hypothetical protein
VPHDLVEEFRQGGKIDVRTAQEAGVATLDDPDLFQYAKRSGRVLLTMDEGFLSERRYSCQQGGGIIVLGPQDANRALEAFVFAHVNFLKAYGNALLDGFRVRAVADRFALRYRSHQGRIIVDEVRLYRGKLQIKEQAGNGTTK